MPQPKNASRTPSLSGKSDHPFGRFSRKIFPSFTREPSGFRSHGACHSTKKDDDQHQYHSAPSPPLPTPRSCRDSPPPPKTRGMVPTPGHFRPAQNSGPSLLVVAETSTKDGAGSHLLHGRKTVLIFWGEAQATTRACVRRRHDGGRRSWLVGRPVVVARC